MTIEEKAKAYDEALERASKLRVQNPFDTVSQMMEHVFPKLKESEVELTELKESEDELTWLTRFIEEEAYSLSMVIRDNEDRIKLKKLQKSLAWLENQSESDEIKAKEFLINKGYPIDANGTFPTYEEMYNIIREGLEKQVDKDKLIKELGKYKVKYIQEILQNHLNSMTNKDDERLRKTTIAFLKEFADKGYENAVECIVWLEMQGNTSKEVTCTQEVEVGNGNIKALVTEKLDIKEEQ